MSLAKCCQSRNRESPSHTQRLHINASYNKQESVYSHLDKVGLSVGERVALSCGLWVGGGGGGGGGVSKWFAQCHVKFMGCPGLHNLQLMPT